MAITTHLHCSIRSVGEVVAERNERHADYLIQCSNIGLHLAWHAADNLADIRTPGVGVR